MKFAGWFGIVVGLSMIGMWSFFLAAGQVPEVHTEPWRIAFHLAAEFSTALCLFVAGIGLLRVRPWAVKLYLVAAGMLFYSLIVSPGYYAQQGVWAFVVMFAVVLVLAVGSVLRIARSRGA
jgi:hypothetical protein